MCSFDVGNVVKCYMWFGDYWRLMKNLNPSYATCPEAQKHICSILPHPIMTQHELLHSWPAVINPWGIIEGSKEFQQSGWCRTRMTYTAYCMPASRALAGSLNALIGNAISPCRLGSILLLLCLSCCLIVQPSRDKFLGLLCWHCLNWPSLKPPKMELERAVRFDSFTPFHEWVFNHADDLSLYFWLLRAWTVVTYVNKPWRFDVWSVN